MSILNHSDLQTLQEYFSFNSISNSFEWNPERNNTPISFWSMCFDKHLAVNLSFGTMKTGSFEAMLVNNSFDTFLINN